MREIPYEAKMEALELYLEGISTNQIVEQSGLSKGSVIALLAEARQGRFPVPGLKDKVDELHALATKLKKEGLDLAQARLGMLFFRRLQGLGVDMASLEAWLDFCEEISPSPPQGFLPAAMEFYQVTKQGEKSYAELLAEVKELRAQRDSLAAEVGDLRSKDAKARELNGRLEEGRKAVVQIESRMAELQEGVRQLEMILHRRAAALGIPRAKLESQLKELVSLEEEIATMRRERAGLQGEAEALAERNHRLTMKAEKAFAGLEKDMALLRATRDELIVTGQLKGRLEKEIEGLQWAIRIMPFLSDPDKVSDTDFGLIALVMSCLERWVAVQPEFRYSTDPSLSRIKGYVHGRRMELRKAASGSG